MRVNLTPGASRVLRRAEITPLITAESLLLAICEETECRAASLLAEQNIHSDTVRTALLTEPVMMEQPVMTEPSLPEPSLPEPASVPDSMNVTDATNPVVSSDTPSPLTPSPSSASFHKMWDGNDPVYTSPMLSVSPHKSRTAGVEWFVDDVPFFLRPLAPRLGLGMVALWQHISQRETAGNYGGFSRTNHGNGLGHSGGSGTANTTGTVGTVMVGGSSVVGNTNGVVLRVRTKRRSEMEVATEHLLLAIVLSETMAGMWLVSQGITPLVVMEHIGFGSSTENQTDSNTDSDTDCDDTTFPPSIAANTSSAAPKNLLQQQNCILNVPNVSATKRMFRILDAAANRAGEAIRVLEDFVRFVLDDTTQTETWKHYRHRFSSVIQQIPYHKRTAARDTETDVGTRIEGQHEYIRRSAKDILAANFSRLQESLRSIEEYSKCVFPEISHAVEKLRYESYTLQKNFPQKHQRQRTEQENGVAPNVEHDGGVGR